MSNYHFSLSFFSSIIKWNGQKPNIWIIFFCNNFRTLWIGQQKKQQQRRRHSSEVANCLHKSNFVKRRKEIMNYKTNKNKLYWNQNRIKERERDGRMWNGKERKTENEKNKFKSLFKLSAIHLCCWHVTTPLVYCFRIAENDNKRQQLD